MLTSILHALGREYRTRRMGRFSFWVAAYGAALWLVDRLTRGAPGVLWFVFWVSVIVSGVYYSVRLVQFLKHRVLWRLRWRLVVTYLFIAIVPIALIVVLVGLGAWLINGQFAAYLASTNLQERFDELKQLNRAVVHEANLSSERTPEALLGDLRDFYVKELHQHQASYPGLEITLRLGALQRAYRFDGTPLAAPTPIPAWFKREEFAGVVMDGNQLELRAIDSGRTPQGELTVILSEAFSPPLLDLVGQGIGPVGVLVPQEGAPASPQSTHVQLTTPDGGTVDTVTIASRTLQLPASLNLIDWKVIGAVALTPVVWSGTEQRTARVPALLFASSRVLTLNRQLLGSLGDFSQIYVFLFKAVAVIFLIIEVAALVIGSSLTRSMTTTVDRLYTATERVKKGDLRYRINLPGRDQLSALGEAFDNMTASVERLLRESEEKSRLESELEIAHEVQARLFPESPPKICGLDLYGICRPARGVSGDYYDFLRFGGDRVGLALADISGKGISAALLMATIQSALHSQFYDGKSPDGAARAVPLSSSEVVSRLNRQLFENTPREKYATFFYGVYDGATRKLTYTNAGHPAPFLFHAGKVARLEAGGTVVGLFGTASYQEGEVELRPGDALLAFSDGVTEPENTYGEEFGEARLLEVARRVLNLPPDILVGEICRSVNDWTGEPELQDDMTVVVAKALA